MKQDAFSSQAWFRLTSQAAAALLTDPNELRFLEPFIAQERTVSEAAAALGVPLDSLYFRVRRAVKLGILQVARVEARAGRPVKRYTSSALGFFVPYQLAPTADFEALALTFDLRLERLLMHSLLVANHREEAVGNFGIRIFRDAEGRLELDAAFSPERPYDFFAPENPATFSVWPELMLDFGDAKTLQSELAALWQRYAAKRGGQRYLLRLGLAPLLEGRSRLDGIGET